MKAPTAPGSPIPAFIQVGPLASTIINTAEIVVVHRELMEVTDEQRPRYKGLITPTGEAYIVRIVLKDGSSRIVKCVTEENQTDLFDQLSKVLNTHVLKLPPELEGVFRTLGATAKD